MPKNTITSSKEELLTITEGLDKDQVIQGLKSILSSIVVLTYKLAQFHWIMKGSKFLSIHPKFGDMYVDVFEQQDKVAERLRQLLSKPNTTLEESINDSVFEENKDISINPDQAIMLTLKDFREFEDLLEMFSQKCGKDLATQQMILDLQMYYSQQRFLLENEL